MLEHEPTLRPGLYRMPEQPLGPRILIPAFRQATEVRGAFGWFSAGWISRLAPGLAIYLNSEGANPIQFTVAPELFARERETVEVATQLTPEEAAERIAAVFVAGKPTADALANHALDCLAWMLATGKLVLRIAVPYPWSNYHPKIWLFADGVEKVVVRGSGNATSKGVGAGVEHMDVDVSWDPSGQARIEEGVSMLADWERGRSLGIKSVHDLDQAIKERILRTAPDSPPTMEDYLQACLEAGKPAYAVTWEMISSIVRERSTKPRLVIPGELNWTHPPYAHQCEAVTAWERGSLKAGHLLAENGVIAMATGAGKTITALICATRAQDRRRESSLLVVVSAPSSPLIRQWKTEVQDFGITPTTPTLGSQSTTKALTNACRRILAGGTHVIIVTNNLLCTKSFQQSIQEAAEEAGASTMLIADEAHTLGAEGFISHPPEFFDMRLGLSATPERQYDPDGTEELFRYFGETVYEFGLGKAIGFCLVPYRYYVHVAKLSGNELAEFVELSNRIGALVGKLDDLNDQNLTRLLIRRRRIVETAQSKIELVRHVLEHRDPRRIKHALVYASSKNPEQFEALKGVLDDLGIVYAEVTERQSGNDALLGSIFDAFRRGEFQVLLAKKVLDEGVDIPSIREAFLVASSTVEREWVQRRGRVLRRSEGKTHAVVHDFLALPPVSYFRSAGDGGIRKVVANEVGRATTFAKHAENASGADGVLAHIRSIREAYWSGDGTRWNGQSLDDEILAPGTPVGRLT